MQCQDCGKLCLRSLLYSSFGGSDIAVDAAFEPIYWPVDNMIRWYEVVFVVLVIVLTSSIVAIAYLHLSHGNGMSWDPLPWVTAHSASVMAV
ncbi:hypothetical protein CapIbe_000121 [Capra ibex]